MIHVVLASLSAALLPAPQLAQSVPAATATAEDDLALPGIDPMSDDDLREASGRGAAYGIDLAGFGGTVAEAFQTNSASTVGTVEDTQVSNSQTGSVTDNLVTGNSGITTVFINSGNNVVLQSTIQVNAYTPRDQ